MKNINKKRMLLFISLGVLSLGVGFLSSCSSSGSGSGIINIETKDGVFTAGYYPQTIVEDTDPLYGEIITSLNDNPEEGKVYTYNGDRYTFLITNIWPEGGGKYSNGHSAYSNHGAFFKWEPLEWKVLYPSKEQNVTFCYATYTIDAKEWQTNVEVENINQDKAHITGTEIAANDWEHSTLRQFLNNDFYEAAFDDKEKGYVVEFTTEKGKSTSEKETRDKASIISEKDFDDYKSKLHGNASDYAKARGLYYHFNSYDYCWFYLNTKFESYSTYYLSCVRGMEIKGTTGYPLRPENSTAGVRPLIAIDNNKAHIASSSDSGQSSTSAPKSNEGTGALVAGIILSVIGLGGVITFFILWGKGVLHFSNKIMIPIIAVSLVICCAGVITLSAGSLKGVGGGLIYGYYTQADGQYSDDEKVQVGYTGWLIKSDHTCYYCGYLEDLKNASDFRRESPGTWTYSNGKITCKVSNPMGEFTNTYTVKPGGKLYYGSILAYQWVREED